MTPHPHTQVARAMRAGARTFSEIEARVPVKGKDLRDALYAMHRQQIIESGEDHDHGWYLTLRGEALAG